MVMSPDILRQREKEKRFWSTPTWLIRLHNESRAVSQIILNMTNFRSVGFIGLMEAIERYDDDKNVPFRVYAEIRVNGAMLDFLRKEDWMPRNLRQQVKEIQRAEHSLTCPRGRTK